MKNEIARNPSFEDKMMMRIKETIGDLITDEELAKIVERGIEKAFFEPRKGDYGRSSPSIMETLIENLMKERVAKSLDAFIERNEEKLIEITEQIIKDGAGMALVNAMDNRFNSEMCNLRHKLSINLSQRLGVDLNGVV